MDLTDGLIEALPYAILVVITASAAALASVNVKLPGNKVHQTAVAFGHDRSPKTVSLSNPFLFFTATSLIVFSGGRYFVGTDFAMNLRISEGSSGSLSETMATRVQEPGYTLLLWLALKLTSSPSAIFWLCAAVTILLTYLRIRASTKYLGSATFIFVLGSSYLVGLNVFRQALAVAIMFAASVYIGRSRFGFVLATITAALIHISALPASLVMLVLNKRAWRISTASIVVLGSIVVIIVLGAYPSLPVSLFGVQDRYAEYLSSPDAGSTGTALNAVFCALIFGYVLLRSNQEQFAFEKYMLLVAALLTAAGLYSVEIGRLSMYFSIFSTYVVATVIHEAKVVLWERTLVYFSYCVYGIAYILNFGSLIPYRSVLWQ